MDILKVQVAGDERSASSAPPNENSLLTAKPRPKVRIIHLISPEIIKTDVDNFRELVQRLTGLRPAKRSKRLKAAPPPPPAAVANAPGPRSLPGSARREDAVKEEEEEDADADADASASENVDGGAFLSEGGEADGGGLFGDFGDLHCLHLDACWR